MKPRNNKKYLQPKKLFGGLTQSRTESERSGKTQGRITTKTGSSAKQEDKSRQYDTGRNKTGQYDAGQNKTGQNEPVRDKTNQRDAVWDKTGMKSRFTTSRRTAATRGTETERISATRRGSTATRGSETEKVAETRRGTTTTRSTETKRVSAIKRVSAGTRGTETDKVAATKRVAIKKDIPTQNKNNESSGTTGERLQKVIAQSGVTSRRQAEELILDGKVKVNGKTVMMLGTRVKPNDRIEVNGLTLQRSEELYYYMLHKPVGVITSVSDERERRNVLDLLEDIEHRVYPVGRLDYDTSGLLLMTNDGELTYRLTHPSYGVDKTYIAGVKENISKAALERLQRGVWLNDGKTAPAGARSIGREQRRGLELLEITIHEGRNRQVRRMCEAVGLTVETLKRIRFGPVSLDKDLSPGKYRALNAEEVQKLQLQVGLATKKDEKSAKEEVVKNPAGNKNKNSE